MDLSGIPRPLADFARQIGPAEAGPVVVEGGRTQWDAGGEPLASARTVVSPAGVIERRPADLTVTVLAGTTVVELNDVLAEVGQRVALPARPGATVGGVLSVGASGVRRRGDGPVRDALLGTRVVLADGRVARAGGPTVKNVSGFDVCRLLVGSLGTLACFGELTLRTRPLPERAAWFAGEVEHERVLAAVARPGSLLTDGCRTWVLIEGSAAGIADLAVRLAALGMAETDGPPPLPPHRWSLTPAAALHQVIHTVGAVAEVGVGIVHSSEPPPPRPPAADVTVELHRRLLKSFDPTGRLNPGRRVVGR